MFKNLVLLLSSGFGIGFLPKAPGTFASACTLLVYMFFLPSYNHMPELICAVTLLGIFLANLSGEILQKHDHSAIVIDEIAVMLIVCYFAPQSCLLLWIGFVLFQMMIT